MLVPRTTTRRDAFLLRGQVEATQKRSFDPGPLLEIKIGRTLGPGHPARCRVRISNQVTFPLGASHAARGYDISGGGHQLLLSR